MKVALSDSLVFLYTGACQVRVSDGLNTHELAGSVTVVWPDGCCFMRTSDGYVSKGSSRHGLSLTDLLQIDTVLHVCNCAGRAIGSQTSTYAVGPRS